MTLEQILQAIAIVQKLLTLLGDKSLSESITWLLVQKNAEKLRAEGHAEPGPDPEAETE